MHTAEGVVRKLEGLTPEGLGISLISLAELYEGVFNSTDPASNEQALQDFLSGFTVVTVDKKRPESLGGTGRTPQRRAYER